MIEIFQISSAQFLELVDDSHSKIDVDYAAKMSSDIITGFIDGQLLGFVGLAPPTLVSDSAYIWMITTDFGIKHRFLLARNSRKFLDTVLAKYSAVYGQCFTLSAVKWLRWLGAEFTSETDFIIRRA